MVTRLTARTSIWMLPSGFFFIRMMWQAVPTP
jgi:hypothetical protein